MQDTVTVRDVMSREFLGVSESDTLDDVLELMLREGVGNIVVVRGEDPVGLVTELELLELVAADEPLGDQSVDTVMRPPPTPIDADQDVGSALDALANLDEGALPVTNGSQELVGVVTESDLLTASASLFGTGDLTAQQEHVDGELRASARNSDPYPSEEDAHVAAGDQAQAASYSTQSVCEICGGLAELTEVNGQLLCQECRDV